MGHSHGPRRKTTIVACMSRTVCLPQMLQRFCRPWQPKKASKVRLSDRATRLFRLPEGGTKSNLSPFHVKKLTLVHFNQKSLLIAVISLKLLASPLSWQEYCSEGNLKRHVSTVHQGIRPFVCPVCGNMFTQKGHMTAHLVKIHAQDKTAFALAGGKRASATDKDRPFVCEICDQRFTAKGNLKRHMLKVVFL